MTLVALGAGTVVFLSDGGASPHRDKPRKQTRVVFGHSVRGKPLAALRLGDPDAERKALVIGVIHGDETAGAPVIRTLRRRYADLKGVDLWTVLTVNPDGEARDHRLNARAVDLNRNFSYRWSGSEPKGSGYYAGPHAFSEPEAKALAKLINRVDPDVTIYYHQPWGHVLAPCEGDARLERRYSEISAVPVDRCRGEHLPGTATSWQEHGLTGSSAFVVELPGGAPSAGAVRRNARAAAVIARDGTGDAGRSDATSVKPKPHPLAAIKPPIHDMLIPFPAKRKHQMAAYSRRHYGEFQWRLEDPQLVIEHLSVTSSVAAVFNTFAADYPDGEFGELPNTCSHYVIGSGGAIFRLVPTTVRCRHTVGLNHVSIGIEHVGYAEGDVLNNPRELRSSLRLTRWLRCRYGLEAGGVIGHNESLSSPFYKELDPRFRGQTHGDWRPPYMARYRRLLRAAGTCPA